MLHSSLTDISANVAWQRRCQRQCLSCGLAVPAGRLGICWLLTVRSTLGLEEQLQNPRKHQLALRHWAVVASQESLFLKHSLRPVSYTDAWLQPLMFSSLLNYFISVRNTANLSRSNESRLYFNGCTFSSVAFLFLSFSWKELGFRLILTSLLIISTLLVSSCNARFYLPA